MLPLRRPPHGPQEAARPAAASPPGIVDTDRDGPLTHVREHPEIAAADLDLMRRTAREARYVLDIGAGRGGFVAEARRRGIEAWALDAEPAAAAIWARNGVAGVLGDAFEPPFREAAFDIVRLKELIEHVEQPRRLVAAASALLRDGGRLIAHVPSPYSQFYPAGNFWDDYTHVRPFSRLGLRRLMEDSGLRVLRIDGYTAGRSAPERLAGKILGRVLPHTYRILAAK